MNGGILLFYIILYGELLQNQLVNIKNNYQMLNQKRRKENEKIICIINLFFGNGGGLCD